MPGARGYSRPKMEGLRWRRYVNCMLYTLPSAFTMEMMQKATKRDLTCLDLTLQRVIEDMQVAQCRNGLTGYKHIPKGLQAIAV
jgi:hypothetical protein